MCGREPVAAEQEWSKSSYSASASNDCVEIATGCGTVHVRDSKNVHGPQLGFTPGAWGDFVTYASGH
ncbi:DUF397 domain-containing protein [Streptomyces spiramyceticus]|uniref:DUF397 domain-containing protein n=1 Tax=Streptomyces spiramyceticus TaxID=299717 RepID=UPI00237BB6CC|nr:DUF397 domain-containing protein [Streptomyces spiramyceticus]